MIKLFADETVSYDVSLMIKITSLPPSPPSQMKKTSSAYMMIEQGGKTSTTSYGVDTDNDDDDDDDEDDDVMAISSTPPDGDNATNTTSNHQNRHKHMDDRDDDELVHVCEISVHKIILSVNSKYFERILKQQQQQQQQQQYQKKTSRTNQANAWSPTKKNKAGGRLRIPLKIDFLGEDEKFVEKICREFFRLFYMNVIDDSSFEDHFFASCYTLQFHKLAVYFSFDSLRQYTEQKLISKMDLKSFPSICEFCIEKQIQPVSVVTASSSNSYNRRRSRSFSLYHVPLEKRILFQRLIEWFEYCVEDNQLSQYYDTRESYDFNILSHNTLIQTCSFFLDVSSRETDIVFSSKQSIRNCFIRYLNAYEQLFHVIPSTFSYHAENREMSIKNFVRICSSCRSNQQRGWPILNGYSIIPLHRLSYGEKSLQCRLKVCQSNTRLCQFDLIKTCNTANNNTCFSQKKPIHGWNENHDNNNNDEDENEEQQSQSSLFRKNSQLNLFSKNLKEQTIYEGKPQFDHSNQSYKNIIDFVLPNEDECYLSTCHLCLSNMNPTFIIRYNATINDNDST
jgi:hypothetical protein